MSPGRALALAVAVLLSPAARAQQPLVPPTPFSLTISGGVSLGAYESGLLYYQLEWLRANAGRSDLKLTTGASAGSVNSVLAVLDQCGTHHRSPSESLFYRTWVPLGFSQLFSGHATPRAVFSREWFANTAAAIEAEWNAGLEARCDVVMGIAVTRVLPRQVQIGSAQDLEVGRIEERFVLRVQGRGPGQPPRLTNYVDPQGHGDILLLPEGPAGEVSFDELRDLLFASTAVPVAFEPVKLRHCALSPGVPQRCPAAEAVEADFVDGAFFDNTPLRLAASLARAGLRELPGGSARWLPAPNFDEPAASKSLRYLFISPEATAYPISQERTKLDAKTTLAGLLAVEARSFLQTARSKNLYTLEEELPAVVRQVVVPARHFPAASSPMEDFFGFFDSEFRRYDFYLGMYDARRSLVDRLLPRLPPGIDPEEFSFPEDVAFGTADWKPFQCLRNVFDGVVGAAPSCEGAELHDFRILAQTSLERLYHECRAMDGAAPIDAQETFCQQARLGGRPPTVPGVVGTAGDFRPRADEGEVAWVARLLARHHFEFRDLGGHEPSADAVLRRIRGKMSEAVEALAATQPAGQGLALERLGQAAANALIYVPPPHLFWLNLGREIEGGYGYRLPGLSPLAQSLRLDFALQLDGLYDLLSSNVTAWGVTPVVGLEIQPPALSSETLQFGFVVRGGRLFSTGDDFGEEACASNELGECSRWTVQGGAYGVAFEILRLQLLGEWFPPERGGHGLWAISPSLGVQFVY